MMDLGDILDAFDGYSNWFNNWYYVVIAVALLAFVAYLFSTVQIA